MIIKRSLSEQRVIDYLNVYYNIEITTLTPLLLGADMNASVYKAQGLDQKSYFVKLKRGHNHDIGVAILDLLHSEGIQQIIPPIKSSQGLLTHHIDEYTLIVYPYIENQNGFSQILTEDQWIILGKVLRKVHEFKLPAIIQDQIRKEDYSSKWRDVVRSLYNHIEIKPNEDHWAKKLTMFMKEHKKEIDRLLDSAELLVQKLQQESVEFVLCHADIHGGNVLIAEEGSIYIVDWDQPVMAPKERDLMFIGGGVSNVWNNPHEEEFFYKGYGKTEINMPFLAYYRHERIVEDIAEYAQEFLFKVAEEDRSEMYQQFIAMFEPRGVVDIAFRTVMSKEKHV
jgi:spectinomycin phosphotransferase